MTALEYAPLALLVFFFLFFFSWSLEKAVMHHIGDKQCVLTKLKHYSFIYSSIHLFIHSFTFSNHFFLVRNTLWSCEDVYNTCTLLYVCKYTHGWWYVRGSPHPIHKALSITHPTYFTSWAIGHASLQIYDALHISCKLEADGIMNVTDKQLAAKGEKRCVCCINGINRPENGFWIQLTVSRRHF